jgi:hypothetical protein
MEEAEDTETDGASCTTEEYLAFVASLFEEWNSREDEDAFGDL